MLTIICGDALEKLRELPDESVHCCVTSPPYWGLRDYGTASWEGGDISCSHLQDEETLERHFSAASTLVGTTTRQKESAKARFECKCGAKRIDSQLGLEKTPEEYVAKMVEVFREVRRALRKDGTLWLNLGDSYHGSWGNSGSRPELDGQTQNQREKNVDYLPRGGWDERRERPASSYKIAGLKPKDLCGIPWRVAFALQADGWYLRQDIIWAKKNCMPESVTDRCTKSHEYLFLLTKSARYFYDAEAIKEQSETPMDSKARCGFGSENGKCDSMEYSHSNETGKRWEKSPTRNKRSVWTVATAPYPEAHFATYPPDLIKPCILAGTSAKGCCAKCGAPWERIVENTPMVIDRSDRTHELGRTRSSGTVVEPNTSKTIGWQPTCKHFDSSMGGGGTSFRGHSGYLKADGAPIVTPKTTIGWSETCKCESSVIPCTVLDPFAGSGTTGAVALELGRKAILIELNPKYVDLIRKRCDVTPGFALA